MGRYQRTYACFKISVYKRDLKIIIQCTNDFQIIYEKMYIIDYVFYYYFLVPSTKTIKIY